MKNFRTFLRESKEEVLDTSKWKQVGGSLGSTPGGTFLSPDNKKWYLKLSNSQDHAKNEILANRLYERLGVPTLNPVLINHHGRLGVGSPWVENHKFDRENPEHIKQIQKHFGSHAWLANWDAVGNGEDNQVVTHKGMTTIDGGGALNFRAQGKPKGDLFGSKVHEFESLRNKDINYHSHHVFGSMTPQDLKDTIKPVANLPDEEIHSLVHAHGPGSTYVKNNLAETLINRKKDLIDQGNKLK